MLQIQPEPELNKLYSLNNTSGQLRWQVDGAFEEFCKKHKKNKDELWKNIASFFWSKNMLFEFCLVVEGCKRHNLDHGYKSYEQKVEQTLAKVRPHH
jgi:hypothetical protein